MIRRNPIIPGFYPDPSICRVGQDYYLTTSSFEYFPGLPIFHSRDLETWTKIGHAFERAAQLDMQGHRSSEGIFAPTLRYARGIFYLITTDVGGIGNFLLKAERPEGPWSDPIPVQEGEGFTWFDPSLLFDDDGTVYYTRRHQKHIVQAALNPDTGELLTPLRKIHDLFTSDDVEGPHLYHIGEWYYLMVAEGGTGPGHAVSIGRCRTPWGPFESCPANPILSHRHLTTHPLRYTGHGDLIEGPCGEWYLVFLGTRHKPNHGGNHHHLGRETFLAPVTWENGWPVVNGGHPVFPAGWDKPYEEESAEGRDWVYRRSDPGPYIRSEGTSGRHLIGQAATLDDETPMTFAGQRLDQPFFEISVFLEFTPQSEGEEAGLCLFLSEEFHLEIAQTLRGSAPVLLVRQRAGHLKGILYERAHQEESVWLQIRGDWETFMLSYSPQGVNWIPVAETDRRLLCTEVAGGWTGVVAGIYATGNGVESTTPAHFSSFTHRRSGKPLEKADHG